MNGVVPTATVSDKAAKGIRAGAPWVYRTELAEPPERAVGGAVVAVVDPRGQSLGQAFWAERSVLALRMLSRESAAQGPVTEAQLIARLSRAIDRRSSLRTRDAYRVVHGESDGLPGFFVDRYADALVLQSLSEGAHARREAFGRALHQLTGARLVVLRDDGSGRDFEQLPREKRVLLGAGSTLVRYHEGPNAFEVDLMVDAKTGGFLDQVDNHVRAMELSRGEALDTFSYHGGFALALARTCTRVLAVEQDDVAAARARANAVANGLAHVEVQCANAFDVLRELEKAGRTFDTVVVDPPGLAKRKEGLATALRAYHELNLRALKLLKPDGLLVSCSCSGKLDREGFEAMLLGAVRDAKRQVQVLERRGAGIDHPVLVGLPQSEYLKAWFLRVL
jgi:23S rRNA (cytosine1962-C5)-methyltransferase